ncbi:hypothetical protein EIP86_009504 [Pleurotus ostreatoroseus]|nr:hypothetical protein EIP86_009504 [Pleurotus ostreatoroseus]
MTSQNFVGDKLVDDFPPQTIQNGDEGDLTKREAQRDPGVEPGANKRAGAASRNSADFDTAGSGGRGSHGDVKPVQGKSRLGTNSVVRAETDWVWLL